LKHRHATSRPPYRAVIFDMDGVLADSEPVYLEAINAVLESLGKEMSHELHEAIMGHGVEATWEVLIDQLSLPGELEDYIEPYDRELIERLARLNTPLPGARELIQDLEHRRVPIAVASSSWPGWMKALLGGIGLSDAFPVQVSATMVQHPKPAPDLYLLAASRLGIEPEACLAIEDTGTGLKAARAAGMFAVQVRAASTAFPPLPEADLVIDTLAQFDLSLVTSNE
jgi:HAD superfamily hydrolase (TIGR01509 family)